MATKKKTAPEASHDISDADIYDTPIATPENMDATPEIHISLNVITKIVELATNEVPGVLAIAGSNFLESMLSKREAGVVVENDDSDGYMIRVHVILEFGVDLAKTALDVQNAVRDQVNRMTSKGVSRIDVFIDDVKMKTVEVEDDEEELDHPLD